MNNNESTIKLTEWTSCGGCAAKWGASLLSDLVSDLPESFDASLLVGLAPFDDAAVYQLTPEVALVSTTDFFPPLVDDPSDFGAIAAANACSDVFAMGGRVVLAVNIAAFPEELPRDVIASIFAAASETVRDAGGTIAGGHTIRNPEPISASDDNRIDTRFPVQYVIRPQRADYPDYRGYAGRVAGGMLRVGDEVMVLPSGLTSVITGIDSPLGPVEQAGPGAAVTVLLQDDLSISRGDMLCRPNNRPRVAQELEAMVCWMDDASPLQTNKIYSVKHTSRVVRAKFTDVLYRLNISNLHRETDVTGLQMNEVGRVTLHTTAPLMFDDYHQNRSTGCFIIVDEATGQTAGAGMLLSPRT